MPRRARRLPARERVDVRDARARLIVAALPAPGETLRLAPEEAGHARARRLAAGDSVVLLDGSGREGVARIVRLSRAEAQPLFDEVLRNIELMLRLGLIHGDLSAYNILYWEGEITIIDFPQAIHPDQNRSAYLIFERDVRRVCDYFARQGVKVNAHSLASGLWKAHQRRIGPEVDPRLLDPEDDGDRRFWQTAAK